MEKYIVVDIETTGMNPIYSKITEIGAIKVYKDRVETYNELINPLISIPDEIVKLTGIDDLMVKQAPTIQEVMPRFLEFCEGENVPIIGHNIMFDYSFLKYNATTLGYSFERKGIDTLQLARKYLKALKSRSLNNLCVHYDIKNEEAHRALSDAYATYELFERIKKDYDNSDDDIFMPKPLHWRPKKEKTITAKQKSYLKSLLHKNNLELSKSIDELTQSEASKKIDEIIFEYGRRA
ncbi:DNA polymerase-3 subunit alpha (Gram-positive type) [Natranaerovirga hydrolytica]|uniref:DNA polymerase-3 subunit alpha (Gram-positive type) n=1 Tax=Natranaerovirga hydrolytica TaxID=680378 RepID=A0A4R1MGJ3_9FIRM|nr:3'-5' exonuclease [Natranaerovirga hydrolytica]TCK89023.1 DNA polymerase-3 subunit alpha (Gram-positive type) [Natranaerovirga hydrolytica]